MLKKERFAVKMQEIGSEMANTNAHNENPISACFHNPLMTWWQLDSLFCLHLLV